MKLVLFWFLLSLDPLQAEASTTGKMFTKALQDGNLNTIETLLSAGFNPNLPVNGFMPLYFAMQSNRPDVVKLLLAGHADPNAPVFAGAGIGDGTTPLQFAIQLGNLQIASMLITAGAQVDAKEKGGRTALHYAVSGSGHLDAVRLLIEKGADLNARDAEGASPLDSAVWHGSLDTVAVLLAHGARMNEADTQTGATPINEAAFVGNTSIVQYLLQFHPDLGIPDKRGYGPFENAVRMGKEDSALLLLETQSNEQLTARFLGTAIEAAIRKDESAVIEAVLRRGISANAPLPSGAAPLELAVSEGATKVVRLLLDYKADPNRAAQNGTTPLLEDACLRGFTSIASMLLDHGASVDQIDGASGTTALYAAASFGKGDLVKMLLDRGANPAFCGSNRRTPYQAALENGYGEVAALIQAHGGARVCEH